MYINDEIIDKITNAVAVFNVEQNNLHNEANQHRNDEDWFPAPVRLIRQPRELNVCEGIHRMLQRNISCIFIESSWGMLSYTYVFRDQSDKYYVVTRNVEPETFEVKLVNEHTIRQAQELYAAEPVEVIHMEDENDGWGF